MIYIYSKKGCKFCEALKIACDKLEINYEIKLNHDFKLVPQVYDSNNNLLFQGLPQFEKLIKLKNE